VTGAGRRSSRETCRPRPEFYDRVRCGYLRTRPDYDGARYSYEAVSPDYISSRARTFLMARPALDFAELSAFSAIR
jgi:hypothetical protein